MGLFEPTHILVVLTVALILLGPRRIAALYRSFQTAGKQFQRGREGEQNADGS